MSPLRGLRTNCLLAPLSSAAVGALAILIAWSWQRQAASTAEASAHREAIAGLARLQEAGSGPPLAQWLRAHPEWEGVGRFTLTDNRLDAIAVAGTTSQGQEPEPELVLAFQDARTWGGPGRMAAAAPCLPLDQRPSVVVGWWWPAPAPTAWPWLALAGGVILAGGGLGIYLVARVYRPVLWLERAAQAAASGAPEPAGRVDSPETASLRSSLITILGKRSGGEDGGEP